MSTPFYTTYLADELARRKSKNPRYSLRAFARGLGIDCSALSRMLRGKQELSTQAALKLVERLELAEREKHLFLASVAQYKMEHATRMLEEAIGTSLTPRIDKLSPAAPTHCTEADMVLALAPVLIYLMGHDKRILYTNPAGAAALKLTPAEMIGRSPWELKLPQDLLADLEKTWKNVVETKTPHVAKLTLRSDHCEKHFERRLTPILDRNGEVQSILSTMYDVTEFRAAKMRFKFLAEAGRTLMSSLDYKRTLQNTAHLAASQLADWCLVHIVERDGSINCVELAHRDPETEAKLRNVAMKFKMNPHSQGGFPYVLLHGIPQLIREVGTVHQEKFNPDSDFLREMATLGIASLICVPIKVRSKVIGTITLANSAARPRFSQDDLEVALELAARASVAIDNSLLYSALKYTTLAEVVAHPPPSGSPEVDASFGTLC